MFTILRSYVDGKVKHNLDGVNWLISRHCSISDPHPPWKGQKTFVFRGFRNGLMAWNKIKKVLRLVLLRYLSGKALSLECFKILPKSRFVQHLITFVKKTCH